MRHRSAGAGATGRGSRGMQSESQHSTATKPPHFTLTFVRSSREYLGGRSGRGRGKAVLCGEVSGGVLARPLFNP